MIPYPGRRAKIVAPRILAVIFALLVLLSPISPYLPTLFPVNASPTTGSSTIGDTTIPSQIPQTVGADKVPSLSLPQTVISSVDNLIGAGGVIQNSNDNLTLYNSLLAMRLLGSPFPHDELLGQDHRVASSYSFWAAEVQIGGLWEPLVPLTSRFSLLGTNSTGTSVQRVMTVARGPYTGTLTMGYRATSKGPLKWILGFSPDIAARYRLVYAWWNVTSDFGLSSLSKQFRVGYGSTNFTLSWGDVPTSYDVVPIVQPGRFLLDLDLGIVRSGASVLIDPSIIASGVAAGATAFTFQRKIFYEPIGGYYWVFYFDGSAIVYRTSQDGINWSGSGSLPFGLINYIWGKPGIYLPQIYNVGKYVLVPAGNELTIAGANSVTLSYSLGTISGNTISWGSPQVKTADTLSFTCATTCTIGIRYASATIGSTGYFGFSYNWYMSGSGTGLCSGTSVTSESGVFTFYAGNRVRNSCNSGSGGFDSEQDRSVILNSNSQGQVRTIYEFHSGSTVQFDSRWQDSLGYAGPIETIDTNALGNDEFSATSDANYNTHLVFRGTNGNVTYAFRGLSAASWISSRNIFGGSLGFPTLTVDYSTNDVYAFAINGTSIAMRSKTIVGNWTDRSIAFPVTQRTNPVHLGSNFASVSGVTTSSNQLLIVWTEGNLPYNAMFASIPIQIVWSPYSSPADPWNGQGLAPYGQYFSNLGEYVSPSTGMLTLRQTDLSVPGRILSFEVTRVYAEPYSFFTSGPNAGPYLYDSYAWAPVGSGWQLNYPWFSKVQSPSVPTYLHLWDGQGYRVPAGFWTGTTSAYDNHQGEQFRLVRNSTATFLFDKSGTTYRFDSAYKLTNIKDPTGNSTITFRYNTSSLIANVTDTAGRVFQFCYSGGVLQTIYQTSGTCASPGVARSVSYTYNGSSLSTFTDPGNRITSYTYNALANSYVVPWLLSRITYPTQSYTNYTYTPIIRGTQATSYRIFRQLVASPTSPVRRFDYKYQQSGGDQITSANVTSLDGSSGSLQVVSFTRYSFSFAGVTMNVTDAYGQLVRGTQQRFGVNGEIPREIVLVTPPNPWYLTKTAPTSGWSSQPSWNYSSWYPAPVVANYGNAPWNLISGWTDTQAKWIWWNLGAATSSTNETVWFRSTFRLDIATNIGVEIDADNRYILYVDGVFLGAGANWNYRGYYTYNNLGPGIHTVAVAADNYYVDPAGLLLSVRDTATGQVLLRTDTSVGSITNNYRYDVWGNLIYSRKSINPSANWSHESFTSYYNSGLSSGFNAFQDTFSQGNYTRPDESWTVNNATWTVNSGVVFKEPSFNQGGWSVENSNVAGYSQALNGETDNLTATFTSGTPGFYRIVHSFNTPIDGNLYSKVVVRLRSSIAKNLLRVELRDGSTNFDPTDGRGDVWKRSTTWIVAVLNIAGHSNINVLRIGITSEGDTSISGTQTGFFDYAFIANDVPTRQDDGLGQYVGTISKGAQESTFTWSDLNVSDISIRANLFLTKQVNSSDSRVGLIAHYPRSGTNKWALVVHNASGTVKLSLLDEWVAWRAESTCSGIVTKNWYTLNFTVRGTQATGSIAGPGVNCTVTASFSGSGLASATGFGLYSGGYSAIFDNVTIATVFPYLTGNGFSNSFYDNGAPNSNVHQAIAGRAQLSNSTGTIQQIEQYSSYVSWGGLNQQKQRYDSPSGVQWPTSSVNYDFYGNPSKFTDARGNFTTYSFSSNYQYAYLTTKTQLDASTSIITSYAYNFTTGNVQSVTDPMNNITSYQNDNLGRVKRIIYPLSAYINYTYSDSSNYVDTVNENKVKTRQIYDGLGRLIVNDRFLEGKSYSNETYTYDWQNRVIAQKDTLNSTYWSQYDALGRVVNSTRPDGKSTLQTYNDLNAWMVSRDQDNNYRCSILNRVGRLVSVVDYSDNQCNAKLLGNYYYVTNYYYDEVGNLRKVVLASSIMYSYDNLGRLMSTTYGDASNESYVYDNNGNIIRKTNRKSVKTLLGYDALNRVKTVTYCGSPVTSTSYVYDKNGNTLTIQNENATLTYGYDARNRPLTEKYQVNLASRQVVDLGCSGSGGTSTTNGGATRTYTVTFSYNGEFLATITYPTIIATNIGVNYAYDTLGRVLNITKVGSSTYYARSFTFYKNDEVKGLQFGNGLIGNYTYDPFARPSSITLKNGGTPILSLGYTYNNTGTVNSVIGQVNSLNVTERYKYDVLQRLTNATVTSQGTTTTLWYQYDNAGNRLIQNLNGVVTRYNYTNSNFRLTNSTSSSTPNTKISYSYDLNGNLVGQNVTSSGTSRWVYNWDSGNHLLKVTNDGSMKGTYAYDGIGRRVEGFECVCLDIWFYAYRGTETLWQSDDNWGSIDFLSANGMKVATVDSSTGNCYCTVKYYHLDMLGSTRLVTSPSKSITFSNGYQPFGPDNGTPNNSENYKFTGKPYSTTTGLYYYYQRWYDTSIGRFISADPDPQTCWKCANPYTYAKDQPTRLVDRNGARSADVIAGEYQDRVQRLAAMQNQGGPCQYVSADVCLARLGIPNEVSAVNFERGRQMAEEIDRDTQGKPTTLDLKKGIDDINNFLDGLPPCWQAMAGGIILIGTFSVAAALVIGGPETGGLTWVAGFIIGDELVAGGVTGSYLLARGLYRISEGKVPCWSSQ